MIKNEIITFTRGVPDPETFPVDQLINCAEEALLREGKKILQYGGAAGYLPLREWIASQSGVEVNRILMGQGSLQLLDHILRLLVKPRDRLFVEQPTYDRTLTLMRRVGAFVQPIDLAKDGIKIEQLETELLHGNRPLLFYLIPDFQNPTGNVMSLVQRQQLMGLAEKYGFLVVEDAPYRKLRYRGMELPSLFELNPQRVLQLSSFSKLISPGLRVGYAILPPELATPLTKFAEDTYINVPYLNQAIVYQFIQKGWLNSHLVKIKETYSSRLDCMLSALKSTLSDKGKWISTQGGFFVGLMVNNSPGMDLLMNSAKEYRIHLTDGRGFFIEGGEDFIRLPFCALPPDQIREGIERLGKILM